MLTSWDQVNLEQYIELTEVMAAVESDLTAESTIELISILLDRSYDEVAKMDYEKMNDLSNQLSFIEKGISKADLPVVICGEEFCLIPFHQLEFGAFIDLEHLLTQENGYLSNLHKIFSILFRPILAKETELTDALYEDYKGWSDKRAGLFYPVAITQLYYVLGEYMQFRSKIFANYGGLFEEKVDFDDEEDLKGMTSKEREAVEQEKRVAKWGWELLLLKLTHNEPLRINDATAMPIIQALNLLSLYQELKIA